MIELEAEKIETFKKKENEKKKKKIEMTTIKTKWKELDLKEIAEKGEYSKTLTSVMIAWGKDVY